MVNPRDIFTNHNRNYNDWLIRRAEHDEIRNAKKSS